PIRTTHARDRRALSTAARHQTRAKVAPQRTRLPALGGARSSRGARRNPRGRGVIYHRHRARLLQNGDIHDFLANGDSHAMAKDEQNPTTVHSPAPFERSFANGMREFDSIARMPPEAKAAMRAPWTSPIACPAR